MMEDTIRIGKQEVSITRTTMDQRDLKFDPRNPRIYTLLGIDDNYVPSQTEIQSKLHKMEHVNALVQSIEAMGGLIDPVIVVERDGAYVVVEGNSRLAAYRKLNAKNPSEWIDVKCMVLPSDINDDLIFMLLGQYHIIGRKDWSPFEQAGYLYRRKKSANITDEQMANEVGSTKSAVEHMVKVYEYMRAQNDSTLESWSYYDELLKSKHIADKMKAVPGFEARVVEDIKTRKIEKARDIRELAVLCKAGTRASEKFVKEYVNGEELADCIDRAHAAGDTNEIYARFSKFRKYLAEVDSVTITSLEPNAKNKIAFELKKIQNTIDSLIKNIK